MKDAALREEEIQERFTASLYCRGYISREQFKQILADCFEPTEIVEGEEDDGPEQLEIGEGGFIEEN